MLADKEMFDIVEKVLDEKGKIKEFEDECGKIKGRMMITLTDIPEGAEVVEKEGSVPVAFEASFDFYDSTLGVAIYPETKQAATGLWVTPQKDGAEPPDQAWIEFFLEKLMESISDDGSYGIPIYSFVNDTSDMTIVPAPPDEE